MKKFTENTQVLAYVKEAHELKKNNHRFSDVVDADGNQYVDLVQEGGGVLGIALVGYTYILEQAGIRFMSLAGTSAGAINTMMMAALGKLSEPKSTKILEILSNQDLFDLVDGPSMVRRLIDKIIRGEKGVKRFLIWKLRGWTIFKLIRDKLGLNPGDYFNFWIEKCLSDVQIESLDELYELRKELPKGLKNLATNKAIRKMDPKLALITSDITTHTKAEFPRMAELYWSNPNTINPTEFVRASMSIPFFFEPFLVNNIPNAGKENDSKWYELARYSGEVPKQIKFVDGGMLSNFPINVFHREDGGVPRMPTFGVRLSVYREGYSKADSLLSFSGAMVSTMRQIHDYDFLLKNPDYSKLICRIDADEKFNWLDFNMSEAEQIKLFVLGAEKAIAFLKGFDWEGYKDLRAKN